MLLPTAWPVPLCTPQIAATYAIAHCVRGCILPPQIEATYAIAHCVLGGTFPPQIEATHTVSYVVDVAVAQSAEALVGEGPYGALKRSRNGLVLEGLQHLGF